MPNFTEFIKFIFENPKSLFAIIPALALMLVNGWTDAPVTIASAIRSKALPLKKAIWLTAAANILGAYCTTLFSNSVAVSIYEFSNVEHISRENVLILLTSAILTVVIWSLVALYFGLPTSESHALLSGLSGAAFALNGASAIKITEGFKVFLGVGFSVFAAAGFSFLICHIVNTRPPKNTTLLKKLQIVGAAVSSFAHGSQDGQKFAGLLTVSAALYINNENSISVPLWTILLSAGLISLGTLLGGRKIIASFESFTSTSASAGVVSDMVSATVLLFLSTVGIPASTTHAKTCAVIGAGFANGETNGIKKVFHIITAWVVTFPLCFMLSFILYYIIKALCY